MNHAEDFDPFFNDMFKDSNENGNDSENFLKKLNEIINEQKDIDDEFKEQTKKWSSSFIVFEKSFKNTSFDRELTVKSLKDIEKALDLEKLELKNLFKKLLSTEKQEMKIPKWFEEFLKKKTKKFRLFLHEFLTKLYKSRFTDEFLGNRKNTYVSITEQIEKAKDLFVDENNVDPFYIVILKDIIKGTNELKLYDDSIKEILIQTCKKVSDYINDVYQDYLTFKKNFKNSSEKLKEISMQGDESMSAFLKNIDKEPVDKIRVKRYNIELNNYHLSTLQIGKFIDEKIVSFFCEYMNERNIKLKNEKNSRIYINKYNFFECIMPPGPELNPQRLDYNAVKSLTERNRGKKHTIFHNFDKLLYIIPLTDSNWNIIEINNKSKEIIVYDPQFYFYGTEHEKLIDIFRNYMNEELKDKGELNEIESSEFEQNYVGRSGMCPQINYGCDSGIFTLIALKILADGNVFSKKNYNTKEIMQFRLDFFSLLVRIGLKNEENLNFELLI